MATGIGGPRPVARRYADAALAALVVAMVGMMIVPLPTALLDVLIASNISLAVLLLLVSLYIKNGVSLTSFPTILLITTLYRLALNVSSTRLILLQADAGDVIRAFGDYVVGGNYVVGAIVFLILTLIQFLVVAKGSERVAEVGARFALDAMPGKQMSIDAELRSGAISQDEARKKRDGVMRESAFYGSMDGAMKFVKGDAIAGIIITVINILGGLTVGVLMNDMGAVEALETYGLLTIGDGLVSQIPALLISTAAGLVVTRVSSEDADASLGSDVAKQVFGDPRALAIASFFLVGLAIIPGLPAFPFLIIAVVFFVVSRRLSARSKDAETLDTQVTTQEAARETRQKRAMVPVVIPVAIDLGDALADELLDDQGGGPLLEEAVPALRDALFIDRGLALPGVRARRAPGLAPDSYAIAVQEVPVGSGALTPGQALALAPPEMIAELGVRAIPATDPVTGGPACLVAAEDRGSLLDEGIPCLDAAEAVTRHLRRAVELRAHDLVGLQEVQAMLDQLERAYPALVRHVVPKPVSLSLLTDVLRRLVEEAVSIRPLREILEALATYAPNEKDPMALTELVRGALKRQLTHQHAEGGILAVHLLDPMIEEAVRDSIQRTATGSYLAMPPDMAKDVIEAVRRECFADGHGPAVLLTQPDVRRFLRRLLEVDLPDVAVLSYQELAPEVSVQPLGRVGL